MVLVISTHPAEEHSQAASRRKFVADAGQRRTRFVPELETAICGSTEKVPCT